MKIDDEKTGEVTDKKNFDLVSQNQVVCTKK